jgi:putative endonuclease
VWPFRRHSKDAPRDTARLGRRGETLARKHLRKAGLKILARNYACAHGEIDLVAFRPRDEMVVFVEVKTRTSDRYTEPYGAVDAAKQRKLRKTAAHYLAAKARDRDVSHRFDVVSITAGPDGPPRVEHIESAFDAS